MMVYFGSRIVLILSAAVLYRLVPGIGAALFWEKMSQGTFETIYNKQELDLIQSKANLKAIVKKENISYQSVCTFGSGFYGADMLLDRQDISNCVLRGVSDRMDGVHSLWGEKHGRFNGYIDTLLLYLLHSNVSTVVFTGDSIAAQNAQSFVCDIMRNSKYFHFPENTNYLIDSSGTAMEITYKHLTDPEKLRHIISTQMKVNHKFSEVLDKHVHKRTIVIRNVRNGPEQCFIGIEPGNGCETLEKSIDRYYNITKTKITGLVTEYCNDLPASEKCVIMWNEGLHWHYNITRPYNSKGMTRALLEVAKAERVQEVLMQMPSTNLSMLGANSTSHVLVGEQPQRKHYLLYRETTAQCFNKKGGDYFGDSYLPVNSTQRLKPFCCVTPDPIDAIMDQGWRNRDVFNEASSLDPLWPHYMGWIRMFNHTMKMCDLKVEQNPNQPPDCTHFVYTPTSFDILWHETYLAFYHLIHHRFPIE